MAYPPQSPGFYWRIANACYEDSDSLGPYLRRKLPGVECIDQERFPTEKSLINLVGSILGLFEATKNLSSWKVRLFRHKNAPDKLIVGFRGTVGHNIFNWIDNISFFCADPTKLHEKMGKTLGEWEREHRGKITVFVGHSAGGFHATHVRKKNHIYRITFNAYKAERGDKNEVWNLRTADDSVSTEIVGSVQKRYVTICDGGHDLKDFRHKIDRLTWAEIAAMQNALPSRTKNSVPKGMGSAQLPHDLIVNLQILRESKKDKTRELQEADQEGQKELKNQIESINDQVSEILANLKADGTDSSNCEGADALLVASQVAKLQDDDAGSADSLTSTEERDLRLGENLAKYQAAKGILELVRGAAECIDPYFGMDNRLVHAVDVSGAVAKCVFEAKQGKVIYDSIFNANTAAGLLSVLSGNPGGLLLLGGQAVSCYSAFKELFGLLSSQSKDEEDIDALEELSRKAEVTMDGLFQKFEMLEAGQREGFTQILENLESARKEIQELAEEIRKEIKQLREELIGRSISQEGKKFQEATDQYMQGFNEDARVLDSLNQRNIESFLMFFDTRMRHVTEDVRVGIVASGPLVESSEFVKAPDYFSGLIAKSAGLLKVGNVRLYLGTLRSIMPLLHKGFWVENHHSHLLQSVTLAQEVGGDILELMETSEPVIWNCLDEYAALRKTMRNKRDRLKQKRVEFQKRWLEQNQVNKDRLRSQQVADAKFALPDFVHKGKINLDLSEQYCDANHAALRDKVKSSPALLTGAIFLSTGFVFRNVADLLLQQAPRKSLFERGVDELNHALSDRSIVHLTSMRPGTFPRLFDVIVEISKKTLTTPHACRWNFKVLCSQEPPPNRVNDLFWCRIHLKSNTIHIPRGSAIQYEDLNKIPEPSRHPNYSSNVSKLYDSHFKLDKPRSTIVLPLDGECQIPLLFPDNYIAYWERKIGLFDTPGCTFVPFYEFKAEGDIWKLSLIFRFVKNGANPKECARLVCAQFDKTTVDAFQGNVNELLMQAFGGDEFNLGMPDKQCHRLRNKMVAPHETRFPGLFALMQKKPSLSIKFDSAEYDKSICQSLDGILQSGTIPPGLEKWVEKADWNLCEGYFEAVKLMRQKQQMGERELKQYTKAYETLLGWSKLTSSLSQKKLQMFMWEKLGLPPPAVAQASPIILPIDILGFQGTLEDFPSIHLTEMREALKKLNSWSSRTNSHRVGEILGEMREVLHVL